MQRVNVEVGTASFLHVPSRIELEARADASIQTKCADLDQSVSIEASSLAVLELWFRARRLLSFHFVFAFPSPEPTSSTHLCTLIEKLVSSISSDLVGLPCSN